MNMSQATAANTPLLLFRKGPRVARQSQHVLLPTDRHSITDAAASGFALSHLSAVKPSRDKLKTTTPPCNTAPSMPVLRTSLGGLSLGSVDPRGSYDLLGGGGEDVRIPVVCG
jgi:hypothetical protein